MLDMMLPYSRSMVVATLAQCMHVSKRKTTVHTNRRAISILYIFDCVLVIQQCYHFTRFNAVLLHSRDRHSKAILYRVYLYNALFIRSTVQSSRPQTISFSWAVCFTMKVLTNRVSRPCTAPRYVHGIVQCTLLTQQLFRLFVHSLLSLL